MIRSFCRYVLFKRHYDKYVDLAEKYKEAKSIAYYLEERYHEIKVYLKAFLFHEKFYRIIQYFNIL